MYSLINKIHTRCPWQKRDQIHRKVYRCSAYTERFQVQVNAKRTSKNKSSDSAGLSSEAAACVALLFVCVARCWDVCTLSVFHMLSESYSVTLHLRLLKPNLPNSPCHSSTCHFCVCYTTALTPRPSTSNQFTFSEVNANCNYLDYNTI